MKKILIISLLSLLLLTGCGNNKEENQELMKEVNKVYEKYSNLDSLNENNLKAHIGLSKDDVENYVGVVSQYEIEEIYLAIKPKKGKEDRVKKLINDYIQHYVVLLNDEVNNATDDTLKNQKEQLKKNYEEVTFEEIEGYYVYVVSDPNSKEKILDVIEDNLD